MLVVFLDIFLSLSLEKTDDTYLNFFEIPIKKFIFTLYFFQIVRWEVFDEAAWNNLEERSLITMKNSKIKFGILVKWLPTSRSRLF